MVPSVFVTLEAMPLTPNGKIDRKALPQPDARRASSESGYAPAQSIIERMLTEIFEELLHVQPVGLNDNFFELGGTPSLALELKARIASEVRTKILLATIFQNPTVSSLAKMLDVEGSAAALPYRQQIDFRAIRNRALRQRRAFGFRETTQTPIELSI